MKRYPFFTAYNHALTFYGTEISPIDFENIGLVGWEKIGNKDYRLYKYTAKSEKSENGEYKIELPCNADIIEAVTGMHEDYQRTTPTSEYNNESSWVEEYIESLKFHTNHLYTSGKYIKYRREENTLYFSEPFRLVNVLYKGVIVDDEGLPLLTEREIDAIATYVAYSDLYKKALMSRDSATFQFVQVLKADWEKKCTQAGVEYLNQNQLDEILNVSTSWDRKRFGKSFKPIR